MSDGNSDKKPIFKKVLNAAEKAFKKLHELGTYKPEDLAKIKEYKALINETANVFKLGISQKVPEEMKDYLEKDIFVFSGLKTHAQLAEARSLLKDSDGKIRPYHLFEQDVLKLNEKYNQNYLEAEWQFAQSSSQSAANWANLSDSERYNLQYRTAGDEKVRESHAAINGTTLPKSSEFWISYYPPNGWRCRCIVVLVLASKYPATDVEKATAAAEKATTQIGKNGKNKLEMFRFNPGLEKRVFPKGNS
ncbi:phage minor head protein, partial [Cloacibacterium sp.]|uniref:phage head morphogenesis protein n=1 Tax=Cloacibacterium sp. TaxID=1913682 RepID=UPI00352DCC21